ncbi:galanin receptor 2b-like [Amphiura filiformis]|uniref:galanin receptor 2b-like n=1 Tax=Amphiura filiformis TaxID=82378 RepID=UPI003B226D3D
MEPVLYLRIVKNIIGLFGMFGNTLVCLVIYYNREMHTLTNALIFNQAVIDFLSCIFIFLQSNIPDSGPPSSRILGNLFCQVWDSTTFLFALLVASTFSLVVLTLERYVAIVFPFHYITLFTRKKTSNSARNGNRLTNTHPETLQESLKRARRNVLKTLLLVFAAFVVCWTPNQFFFLFYNLGFNLTFVSPAYTVTVIMAQSNSAVNFFVYGFKYKQFRRGLRKLFRCPVSIEPQPRSSQVYSVNSVT